MGIIMINIDINLLALYMIKFYVYAIMAIAFEVSAQVLFKKSINLKKYDVSSRLMVSGIILYALSGYCSYNLLKYHNLIVSNVIWHVLHFLLLFLISYFVFKESVGPRASIGVFFGIISMFFFITDVNHLH